MKAVHCPTEAQSSVLFVLHVQEELLQQQLSKEQALKERVHVCKYILRQVLSFCFLFLAHFCLKSLCFLLQKSETVSHNHSKKMQPIYVTEKLKVPIIYLSHN